MGRFLAERVDVLPALVMLVFFIAFFAVVMGSVLNRKARAGQDQASRLPLLND